MRYCCIFLCVAAHAQLIQTLKPETLHEFEAYQATVDRELQERLQGGRSFQWMDDQPEQKRKAEAGQVVTYAFTGPNGRSVTDGLVHDWVAAMYVRGVKLDAVRGFLLDTEHHAGTYPEVTESKVLSRGPNGSVTRLRLVKKRIVRVVLDIEYQNAWRQPGPGRWVMTARSRRVDELDEDKMLPPDTGHGFLWRMNSQWSLREDPGGVWVELRSVSLSRDTPGGVGWIVRPVIRSFPSDAILSTMKATRQAVQNGGKAGHLRRREATAPESAD